MIREPAKKKHITHIETVTCVQITEHLTYLLRFVQQNACCQSQEFRSRTPVSYPTPSRCCSVR